MKFLIQIIISVMLWFIGFLIFILIVSKTESLPLEMGIGNKIWLKNLHRDYQRTRNRDLVDKIEFIQHLEASRRECRVFESEQFDKCVSFKYGQKLIEMANNRKTN